MHLYSRPLGATLEPRSLLVAAMAKSSIMPKITKHLVEAAEIRDKHYTITDSQIPGFGIRIMRGGTWTYVVMYRAGGRRRRMGLGHHGVTTPEQARTSAINILARVRNGEDPAASRQGGDHITTVTDLAERFDEEHWTHPGKVETSYTVCIASASNLTGLVKSSVECRRTGL